MGLNELCNAAELTKAPQAAEILQKALEAEVYPGSCVALGGSLYALGKKELEKFLVVGSSQEQAFQSFTGEAGPSASVENITLKRFPLTHENAAVLRQRLNYLNPCLVGRRMSVGCGDRLGLATPGHLKAVEGTAFFPVLAQQSMREMGRTGRTPENVIDDAMWGVFEYGWTTGYGSDADHLKTPEDIDACAKAGFTMFTIDPGAHVDNEADTDTSNKLEKKLANLPWQELGTTIAEWKLNYGKKKFKTPSGYLTFTDEEVAKAGVKYGKAIAHTVKMYQHLLSVKGEGNFEMEMSVDETETPTTPQEHYFVARELDRLGVKWVSLAPRFVGSFEKGVDYIGNMRQFEASYMAHAGVAKLMGDYKLSLHSGSDKFSLYPKCAKISQGAVHLKTAGTSWLEALRVIAGTSPELFRHIYTFGQSHYETDKASYHVSADMTKVPVPEHVAEAELPACLDQFDTRQMLHVTFGSILSGKDEAGKNLYKDEIFTVLKTNETAHYESLARHLARHLQGFSPNEEELSIKALIDQD